LQFAVKSCAEEETTLLASLGAIQQMTKQQTRREYRMVCLKKNQHESKQQVST
jgi:hypothetical protein